VGWATKIYSTLTPGDASHADHLDKPPNKVQLANACEELKEASASIRAGVSPVKSGGPPGGGGGLETCLIPFTSLRQLSSDVREGVDVEWEGGTWTANLAASMSLSPMLLPRPLPLAPLSSLWTATALERERRDAVSYGHSANSPT